MAGRPRGGRGTAGPASLPGAQPAAGKGEEARKSAALNAPAQTAAAQSTRKLNCWVFKKCERQPQGPHVRDLGLCPASVEAALDDVHDGTNAGRACWVVSGTLCKGEVQGTFAQKYRNCENCDFYQLVRKEELPDLIYSVMLLGKLRKK